MKIDKLKPILENKRVVILGFGREGKVWLDILRRLDCCREIAVADMNPLELEDDRLTPISGEHYLEEL